MTELEIEGQVNSFEPDTPVTVCETCGGGPVCEGDELCEICSVRAGLELLEIFTPAETVDGRVGFRFVCRGSSISCIHKGNIDDTSSAVSARPPRNRSRCLWEDGGTWRLVDGNPDDQPNSHEDRHP